MLLSKVDSPFHLVHLAAKRAREINGYYAHLGEGLAQYIPPLMEVDSNKALSIALEEIAAGKVVPAEPSDVPSADPLAFIEVLAEVPALTVEADDADDRGGAEADLDAGA